MYRVHWESVKQRVHTVVAVAHEGTTGTGTKGTQKSLRPGGDGGGGGGRRISPARMRTAFRDLSDRRPERLASVARDIRSAIRFGVISVQLDSSKQCAGIGRAFRSFSSTVSTENGKGTVKIARRDLVCYGDRVDHSSRDRVEELKPAKKHRERAMDAKLVGKTILGVRRRET